MENEIAAKRLAELGHITNKDRLCEWQRTTILSSGWTSPAWFTMWSIYKKISFFEYGQSITPSEE